MRYTVAAAILFSWLSTATAADVPEYRLPAGIEPVSQVIELTVDPSQEAFSGTTSIELAIEDEVERIGINQVGLTLASVRLSSAQGQRELRATGDDWERSWLADGKPIAPGDYVLTIEFSGKHATDSLGMHRARFEERDYIFTQMEAMYARRAFPSFDEPSFKIPFRLIINAPDELTVVANTPVEGVEKEGGRQRVTFMQTPPLPTYLIAYAVGPLDRAAIEGLSVPAHVYVPKGHADQLGFVLRETPKIAAALEEYFGTEYPFRKLDFVAVPEFAFGAMENPGLIAYRTDILLVGDDVSDTQAVNVLNTIAHEIAHIWYGDLVTMAWWDDLWLNEAFASWMAWTILEAEYPQYETSLTLPQARAFARDELTTSRAIRGEVRNNDEIFASVGLHYTKGRALLRMLEQYVGPDVWQRAIRRYLDEFAWSNATERDLWAVVSTVSGLDVSKIAGDYLNQPGFARVDIDESGKVTQERYVRKGHDAEEQLWRIPLHVKYKADDRVRQTYMLLQGRTGSLDLPADTDWIFPDAGANGYYRWSTSLDQFYNLVDDIDALSERERIALLDNSEALLNAGSLAMADYMSVVSRLLQDPHPLVVLPALLALQEIGDQFVTAENRDAFAAFADQALSARYATVGSDSRPDDSEATLQMRPRLMRVLGQFGTDDKLVTDAAGLVDRYFDDPEGISSSLAREAMRITALNDDGDRYDQYVRAYLDTDNADQRTNILGAMYFNRPDVVRRHLEFSVSDKVQATDSLAALTVFSYVLDDHAPLYDWLDDNFDRVIAKAPSFYGPVLPQVLGGSCDRHNLDLLTDFFADRGEAYAASLGKAVEADEACIARRAEQAGSLDEFLAQPPAFSYIDTPAANVPVLFPADGATGVNPDTQLVLTFDTSPVVGTSGVIEIRDAGSDELVDRIDMGIAPSPRPTGRAPELNQAQREALGRDTSMSDYQVTTISGVDFHFFPVIVRGNKATVYPHHGSLDYGRTYSVTISPSVLLVDGKPVAGFGETRSWTFSTRDAPPDASAKRVVVAADGSGDFNTIQGALDFAPVSSDTPLEIFIRAGNYEELVFVRGKSNIILRGEDRKAVQVGYPNNSSFNPPRGGPSRRPAFSLYEVADVQLSNFTISNYFIGQAEALLVNGERVVIDNMTLNGSGDALTTRGSIYMVDSELTGDGDTILGYASLFCLRCTLRSIGPFTWTRTPAGRHGNVFVDSVFVQRDDPYPWTVTEDNPDGVMGKAVFARLPRNGPTASQANFPHAEMVLINARTEGIPAVGWGPVEDPETFDWSNVRLWEYNTTELDGTPADLSARHPIVRQLTLPDDATIIENYSTPAFVLGGWEPHVR